MSLIAAIFTAIADHRTRALSNGVVISQVFGGGGNTDAPLTHDFIELYNRGDVPISLSGWSLQYASATGTGNLGANANQITELNGVIQPGQDFLVQEGAGAQFPRTKTYIVTRWKTSTRPMPSSLAG